MDWESHLQFRVIDGQFERGRIYSLTQQQIDIGRLPRDYEPMEHEFLLREPTLSRVHATLTWNAFQRGYSLEHKSDVNLTLVNGDKIKKMFLAPGDRVQMGLLILEFEDARAFPFFLPCQARLTFVSSSRRFWESLSLTRSFWRLSIVLAPVFKRWRTAFMRRRLQQSDFSCSETSWEFVRYWGAVWCWAA